jgi:hypothetical protein
MKGLLTLALILGGCTKANPDFCDENTDCSNGEICSLDINRCITAPPDTTCADDAECPAERPVCGEDQTCRACVVDDECPSQVCRTDGTCELPERILYVRPSGLTSGACTSIDRCELSYATSSRTTERNTIHLADGAYTLGSGIVIGNGPSATFVGSTAAVVDFGGVGSAFEVVAGNTLHLRGFSLRRGIACADANLDARSLVFNTPGAEV